MRIGIDIDNCISNFDDVLLEEYIKHDKELRNTGIINDKPYYLTVDMFDWSKKENDEFYYNNIQRIAMSLKPLNNAKEVINKLKADGAVEKIIKIAKKKDKTYIMAIGAITNVALAIKKAPDIISKIEIIWLGGHSPICDNNKEFNFRQDVKAIKEIFNSKVDLTIIPCKGVASNLKISIYELEHYIKGKNELCNYLCSRFYDDEIHGIQTRRVIWDISVIAYLINKE